jgi:hypothetical protein
MGKKHFTEEQIAFALRQAESGTAVAEIVRKLGVGYPTGLNKSPTRKVSRSGWGRFRTAFKTGPVDYAIEPYASAASSQVDEEAAPPSAC